MHTAEQMFFSASISLKLEDKLNRVELACCRRSVLYNSRKKNSVMKLNLVPWCPTHLFFPHTILKNHNRISFNLLNKHKSLSWNFDINTSYNLFKNTALINVSDSNSQSNIIFKWKSSSFCCTKMIKDVSCSFFTSYK